ncbi:MAG: DJ-1/PfpI family protein [Gammaproteobacteria bacterium]|jgi:putative intracellular protease/amidase
MRLGSIFYNDFELLDAYGPLEMFGALGDKIELVTIAEQAGPVRSSVGPKTVADYSFDNAPALDLILIPGGIGTIAELDNTALLDFLTERCPQSQVTMSVCTGSALLAKAGLLDGLSATTNKMFFELARSQGSNVSWEEAARWVDAGQYVTSSGVSAGTDMALAVIERLFGQELAEMVMNYTEYQWHRDADQDPFAALLNQGVLPE